MRGCLKAGLVVLMLCTSGPIVADVLPPGRKRVTHELQFEDLARYPDHQFYVWPRDLDRGQPGNSSIRVGPNGRVQLSGLNPLATGQAGGAYLFAVPRSLHAGPDQPPREEWFQGATPGVLKSPPLEGPVRTLPVSDPTEHVLTRYRVDLGDGLRLVSLGEERTAGGKPAGTPSPSAVEAWGILHWGVITLALLAALLLTLRIAARRAQPAEAPHA